VVIESGWLQADWHFDEEPSDLPAPPWVRDAQRRHDAALRDRTAIIAYGSQLCATRCKTGSRTA
jgi:hypothetical protein